MTNSTHYPLINYIIHVKLCKVFIAILDYHKSNQKINSVLKLESVMGIRVSYC